MFYSSHYCCFHTKHCTRIVTREPQPDYPFLSLVFNVREVNVPLFIIELLSLSIVSIVHTVDTSWCNVEPVLLALTCLLHR